MTKIALPIRPDTSVSFSGHETFVLRYGWLKKAFDAAGLNPTIFNSEDAMVQLGVGKNMVRSIRHWALVCDVLAEEPKSRGVRLMTTELGRFLFGPQGADPYLEDSNSLWLIHWKLCTNESRATTWNWSFSILRTSEFTVDSLSASIETELTKRMLKAPTPNTLQRDTDVFIRTYLASRAGKKNIIEDSLDCPLNELGLLVAEGSEMLSFVRGPQRSLSDHIFVMALLEFWNREAPRRETLSFNEIAYSPNSPGCVFKLDESSLFERLDRLEKITEGRFLFADTAGLKQVYRKAKINPFELLELYYSEKVG